MTKILFIFFFSVNLCYSQTYKDDSLVVRSILDSIGLNSISVNDVAVISVNSGRISFLYLDNKNINKLPGIIGDLTKLVRLDLYDNNLQKLPYEIGNLNSLRTLNIRNNKLLNLPIQIGGMTSLKKLYLSHNLLDSLPREIGNLDSLSELDVSSNNLITLPREIGNLDNLWFLHLGLNDIELLPNEIGQLTYLGKLYLNDNQLKELPIEITNIRDFDFVQTGEMSHEGYYELSLARNYICDVADTLKNWLDEFEEDWWETQSCSTSLSEKYGYKKEEPESCGPTCGPANIMLLIIPFVGKLGSARKKIRKIIKWS